MQDEDQVVEETAAEVEETENPNEETATSEDDSELDTAAEHDENEEEKVEKPKPKRDRSAAKRIGQLTAEKRQAERELAQLRQQLEQRASQPANAGDAPKRDDFDDYEDYLDARAEYKATAIAEQKFAEVQKQQSERQQQSEADQQIAAYNEARETLLDSGTEKYDDFEEVAMSDDLVISPHMADAVLVSERGADVMYYLGKNPNIAERIAAMPPVRQLVELGRLEATLAPVKKASSAPSPTRSVTQRGAANNGLRDNMSTEDWMKRREAEIRKQSQ